MMMMRGPLLIGVVIVMVLGLAVYMKLWTIDYQISSNETELIRYITQISLIFFENLTDEQRISVIIMFDCSIVLKL